MPAVIGAALLLAACGSACPISPVGMPAFEVSLASSAGRMALAWHGGTLKHSAIYLRFVDRGGHPLGAARPLSDSRREAYEPDLQAFGRQWVLAWYEKDLAGGGTSAMIAGLDADGRMQWQRRISGDGRDGRNPLIRVSGGQLLAAWIETGGAGEPAIWTARFDASGQPLGAARRAATASTDTWNLNAAVDADGALYLVYDARLGTRASELQLLRIGPDRIDAWRLSADDGYPSVYPDLALQAGRAALTWFDLRDGNQEIYLYVGSLSHLAAQAESRAARITRTSGASTAAYLSWNADRLGLAWDETVDGAPQVHAQLFDAEGKAEAAARRLSAPDARSLVPAIRPWQSGFAIAWNQYAASADDRDGAALQSSTAMLSQLR